MKTIEQIFKDVGEKFPFKVGSVWDLNKKWFKVVARAPDGEWLGWHDDGQSRSFNGFGDAWWLYEEPKPKRYEWLIEPLGAGHPYISETILTEDDADKRWDTLEVKLTKLREIPYPMSDEDVRE